METLALIFGFITLTMFAIAYGALSWGFVWWKFWYWFLIPVFPGLPAVTFLQCIGLMIFLGLFHAGHPVQIIKKELTDEKLKLYTAVISPWITLFVGWIIKLLITK